MINLDDWVVVLSGPEDFQTHADVAVEYHAAMKRCEEIGTARDKKVCSLDLVA